MPKTVHMGESSASSDRDIASILPFSILRYVAKAVSPADADRIRRAAGETRSLVELGARGAWSSLATTLAIAEGATRLTGDGQIGRRGGEELFRLADEFGLNDVYRGRGSIEAALEEVVGVSSRMSVGRVMTIADRAADHLIVEGRYTGGTKPEQLFCDYATGFWSLVPSLFGAAGYAVELECQARGDDRCLIQVSWATPADSPDLASARDRADQMYDRYEALQRTAADLIEAEDVDAVLGIIVERAGHAVLAPRFLLAVQLPDHHELHVHHLGFRDDDSARRAAQALLESGPGDSTLVVDVASKRTHYGCIAAFYPKGTQGSDLNRRLMSAYAAHAAAALEATVAFEQAQRDRDTAEALLDLSRRLAHSTTCSDVAVLVANALPAISGGSRGSIYLWEPDTRRLVLEACDDATDASLLPPEIVVGDIEGADAMLAAGGPMWMDIDELEGDMRGLLEATGVQQNVSIPISARGDFLGLVSASFVERISPDDRRVLVERLLAFADQAAIAFDNARLLERAHHQARHDGLTGLPNRPLLEDRVSVALAQARRTSQSVALLFIDLDRFKTVNDTLGHHAGDSLIVQVAGRLRAQLRGSDTLARLGGDEFVVLLPDVVDDAVPALLARRLVDALSGPFDVAGHEVFISCSVGIAVSPLGGVDYPTLLQHADTAMYAAKAAGRNTFTTHDVDGVPAVATRLALEAALHGAVANGELTVAYQPQVELASGRIIGAEALVRWQHPTFGAVGPDVFVPIAEDSGLILEIDRWVRLTTFDQMRAWRDAGLPPLRMSFNLSTRELRNPALPGQLADDLGDAGIDPRQVELEITERVVMADNEDLVVILHALREIGVRLAIDDFGTGSSVLHRLARHPVDTLKIDRSFISDLTPTSSTAVVAALLQMGIGLGIEVLAEGIETAEQRDVLAGLGCSLAQGYFFSRPVPADELRSLLGSGALLGHALA